MVEPLRRDFNARFTADKYAELLRRLNVRTETEISFRVAETPVFLPESLVREMSDAGAEMTRQLLSDPEYLAAARATIPAAFRVAGESPHPNFMTVDFGLVRLPDGSLEPRLVELQAFPSVYAYQAVLSDAYRSVYGLDSRLESFLGMNEQEYWQALRDVVVGRHDPQEVILLEVTPEQQKTLPDFRVTEQQLGVRAVDITQVERQGDRLFYRRDGVLTPIRRIYNRAIADEMIRKNVQPGFDLTAGLDVEWAGHPNWYFLISKFSLPFLKHRYVPPAVFLDAWMRGEGRDRLSADRANLVLKPLFSYAGKGIAFAPGDDLLQSIAPPDRSGFVLQERMNFESTIETPCGPTQAEIRILYLWPDGGELRPVNLLVRLGRGMMMGVDHNRGQQWVGGSAGFVLST